VKIIQTQINGIFNKPYTNDSIYIATLHPNRLLEDQGEVLKSPTSLASLYRVSAGCLKDLLGSGALSGHRYQEDWLAIAFPFLHWIDSLLSTASVTINFSFFFIDLIARLEQFGTCGRVTFTSNSDNVSILFFF
jgi:hypothetical protein